MDLIFILLMVFNLTVLSHNQSSIQFNKDDADGNTDNRLQKTDRILRPVDENGIPPINSGQPNMPMIQGNYDPIEASYQRQQQQFPPMDTNYQMNGPGDPMGSRLQPGGNFPGDLPAPGIPAQPVSMTGIDRHMPGMLGDNCYHKLRYFMASCEDALLQRQRDTRNARTAPDIQRRLCCSLYFYHDCLSKVVVQHCRDASPMVVNLVMPENRRREMVINCRTQTRDQCNGSAHVNSSLLIIIPLIIALIVLI